tara:strand:- start:281 stop:1156 length:876 start_codon:yes stop_codon:yes gene_type:complete
MESVLAIDVGGTKVDVGLVTSEGQIISRTRISTLEGEKSLYERVEELARKEVSKADVEPIAIGIGCGGPGKDTYDLVSPLNISQWRDFPLRQNIENGIGIQTFIDNDAKALALAEGWLGAAKEHTNFIAMVVSTGIGGGIVLNGNLLEGAEGNAGHVGHVFVQQDTGQDALGVVGLLEGAASGSGIARRYGIEPYNVSQEVRQETGVLVGRAIASVANLLDLQLAVVSGSVAFGFGTDFFNTAQKTINELTKIEHSKGTLIKPGALGDEGPLIGAAAVALRKMGKQILTQP